MTKWLSSVLLLLPILLTGTAPAGATERVLLKPPQAAPAASARSAAKLSTATKETVAGAIARLQAAADKNGTVRVIVGYSVPFAAEGLLSAQQQAQQQREIAAAGANLRQKFRAADKRGNGIILFSAVPFAAFEVTRNEINQLLADPAVITIMEDQVLTPQAGNSGPQIGAPTAWDLGATGQGQTVAVIDWGFEANHPFFRDPQKRRSRVAYEAICEGSICTSGPGKSYRAGANNAHGTSVAGIISGERPASAPGKDDGLKGIAPDADLMLVSGYFTSEIIAALGNIYSQRNNFKIAAVNMSLAWPGLPANENDCKFRNLAISAAIQNLRAAGTATVVSSGNFGGKKWGAGSTTQLAFPACLPDVVSVGSVFSSRFSGGWTFDAADAGEFQRIKQDEVVNYSNAAPNLSLLAPGYPIETTTIRGGYQKNFGGTSAAAPHVAGAFAVLRSGAPAATVDQILEALRLTGKPVKDYRTGRITPRIDVAQALAYLKDGAKSVISYSSVGDGRGVVSFAPVASRASCADDCQSIVAAGASVTLTATPDSGMEFLGWDAGPGRCRGTLPSCTLTASGKETKVSARFGRIKGWASYTLTYYRTGMGTGSFAVSINGKPLECREMICSTVQPKGTLVTLSATVGDGSIFSGWTGPCTGTAPTCSFALNAATTATAGFDRPVVNMVSLTVLKMGSGAVGVTLNGKAVACPGLLCNVTAPAGSVVKLTATPNSSSNFGNWTGLCTGTAPECTVTLRSFGMATANFNTRRLKQAANR